ncbi:MAG: methyl-accepting chemotaxis protein [Acidiferrobacteraceae bacterium]
MVAKPKNNDEFLDRPTEEIIQLAPDDSVEGEQYVEVEGAGPSGPRAPRGKFRLPLLLVGSVLSLLAVAVLFGRTVQEADRDSQYIAQSSQLLMLSQRIAKDAREAALGRTAAFYSLRHSRNEFASVIDTLASGNAAMTLPATPAPVRPALNRVIKSWGRMRKNVDQILKQAEPVLTMKDHVVAINQGMPLLAVQWGEIMQKAITAHASPALLYLMGRQAVLAERIAKDVNLFSVGGHSAPVAAAEFAKDMNVMAATQEHILAQAPASLRPKIQDAITTFSEVSPHITGILNTAAQLYVSQRASQATFRESDPLLHRSMKLVAAYTALAQSQKSLRVLGYIMAAVALALASLYGFQMFGDERKRAREGAEKNRQTQDAILKLLDEMGDLADGDLTIQPQVTEQITGAIADSINFAVKEMRNLVMRINAAAQQVTVASEKSRHTATELASAASRQVTQITETTERVQAMARSMEEMSLSAGRSAEVAQGSVLTAKRGTEAVQNTIQGMDEMREQIQETAKRIKRLGESSQQIGEIVELINDIAEQTNILSLNAAIQAAMAGEAGRGFAVVADEVQRLAERSSEATKQISDLVKTIQADTNEAIASMEKATHGVVTGTRLADAAGQALTEIESVSQQLSDLIVNIAHSALQQSETATHVSGSMGQIQETTNLTAVGTRQTTESIMKLSELARELQASVSGFKLPVQA